MFDSLLRLIRGSTLILAALTVLVLADGALAKPSKAKGGNGHQPVQASIVIDADTGAVLHAVNADAKTYPASLTKMMTLFMVFDQLDSGRMRLTDQMRTSAHAAAQSPSKLGLQPGQTIAVEDAIKALVTKSANDVAVIIAEHIGGSEPAFGQMMTQRARQLGMSRTVFHNASGLPNLEQITTARDMATLGRALLRQHARHYHYFNTRVFTWNNQTITTHNRLMLRYEGADGIKTGFIGASGFNLVSSAKRGNRRLVGAVLGGFTAAARDRRMEHLLDTAFDGIIEREQVQTAEAEAPAPAPALPAKVSVVKTKPKTQTLKAAVEVEQVSGSGDAESANWMVQVGAFKQKQSAHAAAVKAVNTLGLRAGRPVVSETRSGAGRIYRARVTGFTEGQARAACKKMIDNKSCLVIQPPA